MCRESNLVDESLMYIDSTPVKAHANKKKYRSAKIQKKRASYQRQLLKEVNEIREKEGKKPFDDDEKPEKKPEYIGVDAGYVTPNVMKQMKRDDVQAVIPYRRPHGKKGIYKTKRVCL